MASIFISYARDDDVRPPKTPGAPDLKGFVTFLDEQLRYQFRDLGPERPQIWRDTKRISDGAQFTPEIEDALKKASVFLVVLSPNWMASAWCRKELTEFAKYHGPDGIRERIVVVGKRHVDPDKRPSLLQGQVGFRFYTLSEDPEEIVGGVEFFSRGKIQDHRYWDRFGALVAHLVRRAPPPPPPPPGRTFYVAKPASDMRAGYDRVVSELVLKGYAVVPSPTEEIPLESAVSAIDAALSVAEFSIHLLGEKVGPAPEDQLPLVKLQLARAREKCKAKAGFHRIVWAPSTWPLYPADGTDISPSPRDPVDVLARFDGQSQNDNDKVEGDSLSKLIDFLNQHIEIVPGPDPGDETDIRRRPEPGGANIYLYHSEQDTAYALSLAEVLQQRQLETTFPVFDGPDVATKNLNSKRLAECDAVILCWALESETWVQSQARLLRSWDKLGRTQKFVYRAVVTAPPPGIRKKNSKLLFPRSEIDLVVDLSEKGFPTADLVDPLIPSPPADLR